MSQTSPATATETLESPIALPITALVRLLDQLKDVIEPLDDILYARPPAGRPSGSIGAHVRHCLDHVTAFLDGATAGALSYDRRGRGTRVESDRAAALARVDELTGALLDLDPGTLDRPLRLEVQLNAAGTGCSVVSTVGRELAYVISHTVHHHATMAVLLAEAGAWLPERFGVAAATPSKLGAACAR
jgi:uncharacterized damage-inducible protein DinB